MNAYADADLEALIYFKSKGETIVSSVEISENWRKVLCNDVKRDFILNKSKKAIIKKAEEKKLSLTDLTDIYSDANFPFFLGSRDEEEDFIYSTFFRVVEWYQLNEFEPWTNAYTKEISTIYQSGVDTLYSQFELFYLCRSDLILRKTSKFGLEALLYGICVGNVEASKPWKRYLYTREKTLSSGDLTVDYIPTASIIAFAFQRIRPTNINRSVIDQALLLFQTQLKSGGWPLNSKDTMGNILSTCLAMFAISVNKPEGYQRYLDKAKEWLMSQQNEVGCWVIEGGPAVMINILCIEAIKLSEGNNQITFTIQDNTFRYLQNEPIVNPQANNYIVFCEGDLAGIKNKSFDEKCYTKIFSSELPRAVFCSIGACKNIEEETLLFDVIKKINPYHIIIKLIDRDDRSCEEIEELKLNGITVLSLRELESYLLTDEIIEKLCVVCGKQDQLVEILEIKTLALENSKQRGNPVDDLKSASGQFFIETKRSLGLTKCGNNTVSFLRDTMAPLVTQETETYKLLRRDIFGF